MNLVQLGQRLGRARLDGTTVAAALDGLTIADAYAVQAHALAAVGGPADSWKVGSTSAEAQALLGTDEPGAARIPRRFCFTSPAVVPIFPAHDVRLEAEFAFRLGSALPPRDAPYGRAEVVAAIAGVAAAVEIVGTRFATGLNGAGHAAVTADGGANIALVTGAFSAAWQDVDLPAQHVSVSVNGARRAQGDGRRVLGDPMNVMVWIANHQRTRDGMRGGETVSTGTCSGLVAVAPGDRNVADFGTLGAVDVLMVDAAKPTP